ncbi:hypothetical protein D3C80_1036440 [compost metagenome]
MGLGVAAGNAVGRRDRRNPDPGALRPDFLGYRSGHFKHQTGAVFHGSAIGISADIRAVLGELLQQIAVGPVNLDTIETGLDGIGGSLAEVVDDARKLIKLKRTRLGNVSETVIHERLGRGADR